MVKTPKHPPSIIRQRGEAWCVQPNDEALAQGVVDRWLVRLGRESWWLVETRCGEHGEICFVSVCQDPTHAHETADYEKNVDEVCVARHCRSITTSAGRALTTLLGVVVVRALLAGDLGVGSGDVEDTRWDRYIRIALKTVVENGMAGDDVSARSLSRH